MAHAKHITFTNSNAKKVLLGVITRNEYDFMLPYAMCQNTNRGEI